ncbi:AAA family ATPase [Acetobacter persici]|uniref:AAA family ATPase n=1 Tax=Acetobacter persici TaxID=1076596 RepID=UPI0031FF0BBB
MPQAELVQAWREAADSAGLTEEKRRQLVAEAQGRLAVQAGQESPNVFGRELLADQAVAQGAAMLGERNSVFATTSLHEAAGRFALGTVSQTEIAEAITRAETAGELERRTYLDYRSATFEGMTTAANIANEMTLLRLEEEGRHKAAPIFSPLEAGKAVAQAEQRSALKGRAWNEEQRAATAQILTSNHQIVGLQGYAGTAKTSTVLVTVAKNAEAQGYRVTALAPTASAAQVLGDALDSRADTFARVKLQGNRIETISLESARDRHLSHAYVSTAFAAQGRTADRVFANAESSATHLLEQKSFYVALSRAKAESVLYTDDRSKMQIGLHERSGMSATALHGCGADMQDGKQKAREKAQAFSLAL